MKVCSGAAVTLAGDQRADGKPTWRSSASIGTWYIPRLKHRKPGHGGGVARATSPSLGVNSRPPARIEPWNPSASFIKVILCLKERQSISVVSNG